MSSHLGVFESRLLPVQTLSLPPHTARTILNNSELSTFYLMRYMPWRDVSALKKLTESLQKHKLTYDLKDIFYQHPADFQPYMQSAPTTKLLDIFEHIIRFNEPPTDYSNESIFYFINYQTPQILSGHVQQTLKKVLYELQRIQFLVDDISEYWQSPQRTTPESRQFYLAQQFAVQLQCAATVSFDNGTLTLDGRWLITQLCKLDDGPDLHLYEVSIQNYDRTDRVSMAGAFVISRHSELTLIDNHCVLFVPGQPLVGFDSLDALKNNLAGLINEKNNHALLACVLKSRLQDIEEDLDSTSIILTPLAADNNVYNHLIGRILTKQKLDIIHLFTTASSEVKRHPNWADLVTRTASDCTPLLSFATTLRQIKLTDEVSHEPEPESPPPPSELPARIKNPIKIHVYVHQDVEDKFENTLIYENYLSWVVTELKDITGRSVEVLFNEKNIQPSVINFPYKEGNYVTAINGWKSIMTEYLDTTSISRTPLDLHILLTIGVLDWYIGTTSLAGVADAVGGQFAIASVNRRVVAAHEIGHMLGATHEDSAIIYDGWWHDTLLSVDLFSGFRGQYYRFSDANRENIRRYVSQFD